MNRGRLGLIIVGIAIWLLAGIDTAGALEWKPTYMQEFNGTTLPTDWNIRQSQNHLGTHQSFNENGLSVDGGNLVITTTRHCVSSDTERLDASNVSENPCPAGKITKYLSGRLMSNKIVDGARPFRVEIRAKVEWNGLKGTRPSLWMRNNQEFSTCTTTAGANLPYGELDILEWYSKMPAYTWSTSHITCFHSDTLNSWKTRNFGHRLENRANRRSASLANEWHTWAVEYDGEKVSYYVDGELVVVDHYVSSDTNRVNTTNPAVLDDKGRVSSTMPNEDFSKLGVDNELIKKVFNDKWYVILNDYVESKPGLDPPSLAERFPAQRFLIDYVRMYEGVQPVVPPVAPTRPTQPRRGGGAGGSVSGAAAAGQRRQSDRLADTGENRRTTSFAGMLLFVGGWLALRKLQN